MNIVQTDIEEWSEKFNSCHTSNYFYSPNWLEIQSRIFNLNNIFFKIKDNKSVLYISFQEKSRHLYSGFIAYGGFMVADGLKIDINILSQTLDCLESEHGFTISRLKSFPLIGFEGNMGLFKSSETALLRINDNSIEQDRHMDKKTRNLIKMAISNKVHVKPININEVNTFYAFYKETMLRVGSKYFTPISLFEYFCQNDESNFLGAYLDDELIAGSVFMNCRDVMFYWSNSSSSKGRSLDANYLIIKHAIDLARGQKRLFIDMGSSHSPNIQIPKLKWGAELTKFITLEQ
ncbi:peptidoglycan bridge formation glycyltransferase FemA/FemB family protein [Candidatus Amesbacteria bacterium]|nr:peptidoglycan bridge formation glycyltransferase FemA/FemB family protein [Candidatus Amesbacteria bacterium]